MRSLRDKHELDVNYEIRWYPEVNW